jgi:hypothetical protein
MRRTTLLAFAAVAAIAAAPSAQAHSPKPTPPAPWTIVASGLDNPRGLAVAKNGDIWVAEAGKGGAGPCQPGPEGPPNTCFGASGAYTLVHNGVQKRVVTGLPSFGDEGTGDNAIGASDIIVNGSHVSGLLGGGGGADERAALAAGSPAAYWFDRMVKIDPWSGKLTPFADFAAYETANNPDKGEIDSDSYGLAEVHGGFVVADAAGNDVLGVNFKKQISTLAVFPDVMVAAPPFIQPPPPGGMIPMQAVPTTVAVRPKDPNIYVGQLTGFPFPPGAASVWAIKPDGTKTVFATGFTNIVDIAWGPKGSLYVLEITSAGLLSDDPTGALIKLSKDGTTRTTVASTGLVTPTGVAIAHDGTVYVTNYGTSAGKGTVVNLGKL